MTTATQTHTPDHEISEHDQIVALAEHVNWLTARNRILTDALTLCQTLLTSERRRYSKESQNAVVVLVSDALDDVSPTTHIAKLARGDA